MSRTRTLVSTARKPFADMPAHARLHLRDSAWLGRPFGEEGTMNFLETKPAGSPHHHVFAFFVPLEDRAGPDAQLAAHLCRNGNLPLRREFGMRDRHGGTLPW